MIVDTQASGNNRKITAFIGGLDLCDGRYDTPEHRLFRDLDTVFHDDFHNPTFSVSTIFICTCCIVFIFHFFLLKCPLTVCGNATIMIFVGRNKGSKTTVA